MLSGRIALKNIYHANNFVGFFCCFFEEDIFFRLFTFCYPISFAIPISFIYLGREVVKFLFLNIIILGCSIKVIYAHSFKNSTNKEYRK